MKADMKSRDFAATLLAIATAERISLSVASTAFAVA
jgi:hypothetical protein